MDLKMDIKKGFTTSFGTIQNLLSNNHHVFGFFRTY